jgi:hypothetical protein
MSDTILSVIAAEALDIPHLHQLKQDFFAAQFSIRTGV